MSRFASTGARVLVVAVAAVASVAALTVAQDDPQPPREQGQAGLDSFLPEPTKYHELLRQEVGVWDVEVRTYAAGPDQEPQVSKGVERNRLMAGGLWLISDFRGELAGTEYQGHGLTGYDSHKQAYVSSWADSMGAGLMVLEGNVDETSGELTLEGETVDPMSGQSLRVRLVASYDGPDSRRTVMSLAPRGGDEFVQAVEMRYTRQPDSERTKKSGEPKKKSGERKKRSERPDA